MMSSSSSGARILVALGVWVDRLEIVAPRLDLLALQRPRVIAVPPREQQPEELLEMGKRQRFLLPHLDVREVVVPGALGGPTPGEEEQVRLHTLPCIDEGARRQANDAPEVALVEQLPLGLGEGRLVGAEQHP